MAFGTRVTTTTRDFLMPKVVDTILNSNVYFTRIVGAAKKWGYGDSVKFPVFVSKNDTGGSFTGYDLLDTNAVDSRVNLEFGPSFTYKTASLPLTELSVNATAEKVIDLARIELQWAAESLADDLGTQFFGSNATTTKNFLGLTDIVDDGTSVATYGGQSRATYSTLGATKTASGGALSLDKLETLHNAVTSGSILPTIGIVNETVWALYSKLLQPQERINKNVGMVKGFKGGTGFIGLDFKGIPVLKDEKATASTFFFLNENFLNFNALPFAKSEAINFSSNIEGNDYSSVKGLGFSWTNWIIPSNQAAVVSHIYFSGQHISDNPKRQGKLTGITTV